MLSDLFKPNKPDKKLTPDDVENGEEAVISLSTTAEETTSEPEQNRAELILATLNAIEAEINKELSEGLAVDIYKNSVIMDKAVKAAREVVYELMA